LCCWNLWYLVFELYGFLIFYLYFDLVNKNAREYLLILSSIEIPFLVRISSLVARHENNGPVPKPLSSKVL
jgi:hypothetical protein